MGIAVGITVAATLWVVVCVAIGWWVGSWFGVVALGGFAALVTFTYVIPGTWDLVQPGSIRQAKRRVVAAEREGSTGRRLSAHARLALAKRRKR